MDCPEVSVKVDEVMIVCCDYSPPKAPFQHDPLQKFQFSFRKYFSDNWTREIIFPVSKGDSGVLKLFLLIVSEKKLAQFEEKKNVFMIFSILKFRLKTNDF